MSYYYNPYDYGAQAQAQPQRYYDKSHKYETQSKAQKYYGGSYAHAQKFLVASPKPDHWAGGADLVERMIGPSPTFPPGTDPKIVECYNRMDRDGNGVIDDKELQSVLSCINQQFSIRTVHLLMCSFTHSMNERIIGPKEFIPLIKCLQHWKTIFQRFDRDRNGRIDASELRQVLQSLGYPVSPVILSLLISKFDKSGANYSIGYDNFIECCITVKGLTDKYRAKEDYSSSATFTYEEFLLNIMPFILA